MQVMNLHFICLISNFTKNNQETPWYQVKGLCNIYAHEYYKVQKSVLWQTITEDIQLLEKFCKKIINSQM